MVASPNTADDTKDKKDAKDVKDAKDEASAKAAAVAAQETTKAADVADAPSTVAGVSVAAIEDNLARRRGTERADMTQLDEQGWTLDFNQPPGQQIQATKDVDPAKLSAIYQQGVKASDIEMTHPGSASGNVAEFVGGMPSQAPTSADSVGSDVKPAT